jgi:carbamoyl-phosphate synthase large subunit
MIRILVTSAGSLVGQNILDSLESRRNLVYIIGLNSEPENQRMFRCNKAYLVPPIAEGEAFAAAFGRIIRQEHPDIVLAGRDIDVVFLSKFRQEHPEFSENIPVGDARLAQMMLDKYQSYCFAKEKGLPFPESFLYSGKANRDEFERFLASCGFPVVVKPRKGFASLGVFFLTDRQQVEKWLSTDKEIVFQEFLGDAEKIEQYKDLVDFGLPLFFQVPESAHYAAQVLISPSGAIIRSIATRHMMFCGRAESLELFHNKNAELLITEYARIIGLEGWRGFLNMQFKQDRNGEWKVYELNPRMVGASSARLLMGFDEFGMLMSAFYPELNFPDLSLPDLKDGIVLKSLTDSYIDKENIRILQDQRIWKNSKT